jgi:hypothetical protein
MAETGRRTPPQRAPQDQGRGHPLRRVGGSPCTKPLSPLITTHPEKKIAPRGDSEGLPSLVYNHPPPAVRYGAVWLSARVKA